MRKKIFIALGIIILGSSCNQEAITDTENTLNIKSNEIKSDEYLIQAINEQITEYKDENNLLDLLLDNAPLSHDVLETLANNDKYTDDFVELCIIVSAPISSESYNSIQNIRPNLIWENIDDAQEQVQSDYGFSVVFDPQRKVIFGTSLLRTGSDNCEDNCTSTIRNEDNSGLVLISWGSGGGVNMIRKCNPLRWVCGDPIEITGTPLGGGLAEIIVTCSNSENKCVRLPRRR